MRLTHYEIKSIKKAFLDTFDEGSIYLFGSRVDDTIRGGDIDLYLVPKERFSNQLERKSRFLVKLDEYIGEQKIDAILAKDATRLIEQEAIAKGIEL